MNPKHSIHGRETNQCQLRWSLLHLTAARLGDCQLKAASGAAARQFYRRNSNLSSRNKAKQPKHSHRAQHHLAQRHSATSTSSPPRQHPQRPADHLLSAAGTRQGLQRGWEGTRAKGKRRRKRKGSGRVQGEEEQRCTPRSGEPGGYLGGVKPERGGCPSPALRG